MVSAKTTNSFTCLLFFINVFLSADDITLINTLKDKGFKVAVLLISGRPLNVANHIDQWDAFAAIWLPGTEGDGVSDILFGDFSSTGRLSFPWSVNTEEGSSASKDNLLFDIGYGL